MNETQENSSTIDQQAKAVGDTAPTKSADIQATAGVESTQSHGGSHREGYEETLTADLSSLPRLNWGALLMPAVWGPAHGQWITVFFYPIWLLVDRCVTNAVFFGGLAMVLASIVIVGTAAVTIMYARTAGQKAYQHVAGNMPLKKYLARERIWVAVSAVIALIFVGLATWYNLAIRLPAGPQV